MSYSHPDLGSNSIIYDVGRYIVVQISDAGSFAGYDGSDGYVLYDCDLTGPIALIQRNEKGIVGNIISHVGYPKNKFNTMDAAVKGLAKQHDEYLNGVMGADD